MAMAWAPRMTSAAGSSSGTGTPKRQARPLRQDRGQQFAADSAVAGQRRQFRGRLPNPAAGQPRDRADKRMQQRLAVERELVCRAAKRQLEADQESGVG